MIKLHSTQENFIISAICDNCGSSILERHLSPQPSLNHDNAPLIVFHEIAAYLGRRGCSIEAEYADREVNINCEFCVQMSFINNNIKGNLW